MIGLKWWVKRVVLYKVVFVWVNWLVLGCVQGVVYYVGEVFCVEFQDDVGVGWMFQLVGLVYYGCIVGQVVVEFYCYMLGFVVGDDGWIDCYGYCQCIGSDYFVLIVIVIECLCGVEYFVEEVCLCIVCGQLVIEFVFVEGVV